MLPVITMVLFSLTVAVPEYLVNIPLLNIVYKVLYYSYILFMLLDFVLLKKEKKYLKKEPLWVAVYFGMLVISTILFKGFNVPLLKSLLKTAVITILIINFLVTYKELLIGIFLKIQVWVGGIGAVVNLILIILIPDGLAKTQITGEPMWLYGHKNSLFMYLMIAMLGSSILYYRKDKGKLSLHTYILTGIVLVSGILSNAGMVTVCSILLLILMFAFGIKTIRNKITMAKSIFIAVIINVMICLFRMQNVFDFIIVDLLGKNLSLTGRTEIWDLALEYTRQHPVFGVGYLFPGDLYEMIVLSTTHNWIIGILFHMGLIGIALWIFALGHLIMHGRRYQRNYIMIILAIFMFVYMIQGITENLCGPVLELRCFVFGVLCCCLPCENNVHLVISNGAIRKRLEKEKRKV